MSNRQKATGKKDTTAGEQLATMGDVDRLFTIRLAEYHEKHVFEIRQWVQWRNLPWYKRLAFTFWWDLKSEPERMRSVWNWLKQGVGR